MADKKIFKPSFLLIPKVLYEDKEIRETDEKVYACVYWFSELKDGKCFASNKAIGQIINFTQGTVSNSLTRLENRGYIRRTFTKDGEREQIIPLITFDLRANASSGGDTVEKPLTLPPRQQGDTVHDEHIHNIERVIEKDIEGIPLQGTTPAQRVYNFYSLVFRHFYGFAPKGSYVKDLMIAKSILKDYNELQVAMFILLHFEWKGANGNDDFVYKRLSGACFPLSWIKPNTNAYQAFFKHTLKIDLDDTDTILTMVSEKVEEYK